MSEPPEDESRAVCHGELEILKGKNTRCRPCGAVTKMENMKLECGQQRGAEFDSYLGDKDHLWHDCLGCGLPLTREIIRRCSRCGMIFCDLCLIDNGICRRCEALPTPSSTVSRTSAMRCVDQGRGHQSREQPHADGQQRFTATVTDIVQRNMRDEHTEYVLNYEQGWLGERALRRGEDVDGEKEKKNKTEEEEEEGESEGSSTTWNITSSRCGRKRTRTCTTRSLARQSASKQRSATHRRPATETGRNLVMTTECPLLCRLCPDVVDTAEGTHMQSRSSARPAETEAV